MSSPNSATGRLSPDSRKTRGWPRHETVPVTGVAATGMAVEFGRVLFWPPGYPKSAVNVPMGSLGWRISQPLGWEGATRPAGLAVTAWKGLPVTELTVDVVLERFEENESVEPAWELLCGLANLGSKAVTWPKPPPPLMVVRGSRDAKPVTPKDISTRWVISSIDVDENATLRNDLDNRVRIEASIGLLQYAAPKTLRDSAAAIRKATPNAKNETYTAKTGDTVIGVAGQKLHDRGRWPEILALNPAIRDPRAKIKAGTKVKLP